jgi:isopenicillin N synthase-like dioxygenase
LLEQIEKFSSNLTLTLTFNFVTSFLQDMAAVVELDYSDLVNEECDLSIHISKAYGLDGVGVLTVKNVPGYEAARKRLLPLSRAFAILPDATKEKYVHKESSYSFGWSHGKEKLQGKPDLSKGSFYANPQYDRPVDDENIIREYPAFIHPNIWPKDEVPEFEAAFKELGQIIVEVGKLIATQCDKFVQSKCPSYPPRYLHSIISNSKCCKARLLHYFPLESQCAAPAPEDDLFSSWCGWHNDHGSLTGLTSAMYLDLEGREVTNVDKDAGVSAVFSCRHIISIHSSLLGLYVRNRKSELIKVNIPEANIAFQIGETAQIHSGGFLQVHRCIYTVRMRCNAPFSCPSGNSTRSAWIIDSRHQSRDFCSLHGANVDGAHGDLSCRHSCPFHSIPFTYLSFLSFSRYLLAATPNPLSLSRQRSIFRLGSLRWPRDGSRPWTLESSPPPL